MCRRSYLIWSRVIAKTQAVRPIRRTRSSYGPPYIPVGVLFLVSEIGPLWWGAAVASMLVTVSVAVSVVGESQ